MNMEAISITENNIAAGAECYRRYKKQALVGPNRVTEPRQRGFDMIPGAALESEADLREPADIWAAVSRAKGISVRTVRAVLNALGGDELAGVCWVQNNPEYVPFHDSIEAAVEEQEGSRQLF